MNLNNLLKNKREVILEKWFDLIINTYPQESVQFFKRKSQFTNPVGYTISQGIEDILDAIIEDPDTANFSVYLDNIIRIRAVQDFSPSQSVAFIFLLKQSIHEELAEDISRHNLFEELSVFEVTIDKLALMSFDIFMACREKIYNLKATELRDRTLWLLKKANLISEISDDRTAQEESLFSFK